MLIKRKKKGAGGGPRAPLAARLLCALLAALCVGAAFGATTAMAEQPGDVGVYVGDYTEGISAEDLAAFQAMAGDVPAQVNGSLVFCCEVQTSGQKAGPHTVYDLVGAQSRHTVDIYNVPVAGKPYFTWSQDDVTNLALIQQWFLHDGLGHWSYGEKVKGAQQAVWAFVGAGRSLDDMSKSYNWPISDSETASLRQYISENRGKYIGHGYLYTANGNPDYQRSIKLWLEPSTGSGKLMKVSSNAAITDGNPNYSLAGAEYGVYAEDTCSQENARVGTFTTDENGESNVVEGLVNGGTYFVQEKKASKGYKLDETIYKLHITAGQTATITCYEEPENDPAGITVYKQDSAGAAVAQGDATLAGAEFTVRFYAVDPSQVSEAADLSGKDAARTWVVKTVKDGDKYVARLNNTCKVSGGDWYGYDEALQQALLPLGVVTVEETKAPEGYRKVSDVGLAKVTADKRIEWVTDKENSAWAKSYLGQELGAEAAAQLEPVKTGSGKVSGTKVDHDLAQGYAQGDATLEAAEISLYNVSAAAVVVGGKTYEPVKGADYASASPVAVATTDKDGNYRFDAELPYGTYVLKETKAPSGYELNSSWSFRFEIREDGQDVKAGDPVADEVSRGGVGVAKVDAQRDEAVAEGGATLAGAEISVTNRSAHSVCVDGEWYKSGETIDPEKSPSAKLVTDANGQASTSANALPYGTYELRETKASKGYLLNSGWSAVLEVREDGKVAWVDAHGGNGHLEEQVVRGDFNFDKVDGFGQAEMAGVPFLVTSRATGESHVVVTDANGQVDTASSFAAHSGNTNASDAALNADRTAIADESKLVCDGSAGVWFHGYADREVSVDDSLGALPYDTYDVRELAVKANAGHNLVSFAVTVARDGVNVDKGTKEDSEIAIATTLTCKGEKEAPMAESVTLTDEVQFENVKRGEHTMTASVHAVEADGTDAGEVARAVKAFTNTVTTGSVKVDIELDTTGLGGKKLVCFEYLDLKDDGSSAARHEDISDEGQTVSVPKPEIATKATGDVGQEAEAAASAHLTDTVAYKGLTPGKGYELRATLHVREKADDGSFFDGGAVKDASGNEVSVSSSFTPQSAEGEAEVGADLDARGLAGKTVVFFEELYRDGVKVAEHADIADEGQSVYFPVIETHATDKDSGEQVSQAREKVTIRDAVSYTNLTVGKTYKVKGTLHRQDVAEDGAVTDGGELCDAEGNPYTAEAELTAEKADGTVDLEFEVDASTLAGKSVVAFEELSRDGVRLAAHADISDEGQTVRFPEARTTLTDAEGRHEVQVAAGEDGKRTVELTDTVAYRNLEPGRTYKVEGALHRRAADGSDAGEIEGAAATAELVPEAADGSVEVKFTLDAGLLGDGEAVVAFEKVSLLSEDGGEESVVATHEDISDEDQTVRVVELETHAAGAASGSREEQVSGKVTVKDRVAYTGLTPGKEYTVKGTLHVKADDGSDGGAVKCADGEEVSAEASFTPAESVGEVELAFTFDGSAMAGKSVVAFEELWRDGVRLAIHADIEDEDQTVNLVKIGTVATDKADGDHSVACSARATVADKVTYTGLTPGKEYTVKGTLHVKADDGSDGGALKAGGAEVTAEKTFVPEAADGSVEVEFTFDATALAGKRLVAFEELWRDGSKVASHADIADEDQTVAVEAPGAPEEPGNPSSSGPLPQTGVGIGALALTAVGTAAAALAGGKLAWDRRRAALGEDPEEDEEA